MTYVGRDGEGRGQPWLWMLRCAALLFLASSRSSPQKFDALQEYRNPVLFADYSDPDVLRVGNEFYLIASSFHFVPGIPILHSRDLVHWEIAGHVVPRLTMDDAYNMTGKMRYGGGIWAPSLRFHGGLFYVYFPTPDEGIFVSTAPSMAGPWTAPEAVLAGPGFEDPCPFWDDDGQAYLVHSRLHAGPLILHRMSADGKHLLDDGKVIVQDPLNLPTLEGPKLYKRNGWYYIFAPKGGVSSGDQVVLRSRSIYGPYEWRVVLAQGTTRVNGPHQGGWVDGPDGRGWFLHFQQRGAHGRIVWLEPLKWQDDWPLVGSAALKSSVNKATAMAAGEPVSIGELPVRLPTEGAMHPQRSDEFSSAHLSSMWEWNHNPDDKRWSLSERRGFLRLYPAHADGLLTARNTLTESMQDESLQVTTRVDIRHMADGDRVGLSAFERGLSAIGVAQDGGKRTLFFSLAGTDTAGPSITGANSFTVLLRVQIVENEASYSYSLDEGKSYRALCRPAHLAFSWWKGARPALFAYNVAGTSTGFVDFDWLHTEPILAANHASSE
jgi:beta-xylosidase